MTDDALDAIAVVKASLPRLRRALLQRGGGANVAGFVTGGTPSYELIALNVEAVLADVRRQVDEFEEELRHDLGHGWRRSPMLADALDALAVAYDGSQRALGATETAERVRVGVLAWERRCRLVLGEAWSPYPLQWPDGSPVECPVVEWRDDRALGCDAALFVHRDSESGVPNLIRCSRNRHGWTSGREWLRLGALLTDA